MFAVKKARNNSKKLKLNYDEEHDILYIALGKPVPSFSDEENLKGVYIRRAMHNERIVTGATIMDYSKRNIKSLKKYIPFEFEF